MSDGIASRDDSEERRAWCTSILESTADAVIGKSLDGTVTVWNKSAERLYGYSAQEMIGNSIATIFPSDCSRELPEILGRLRAGEGLHQYETVRQRKDGTLRNVSLTISPIRDSQDAVIGASAIARDVTEQKETQRQLEETCRSAKAANEAKSMFLASMSHEIRTPITAILGYAELLQSKVSDPEAKSYTATILENGNYLCGIINDILDLSKIESGKLSVARDACSILEILDNVRELLSVRASEKDLPLQIEVQGQIPETVQTDKKLVTQVLINLVGNAIKFTETGAVRIVARCLRAEELLEIAVSDTGIGINEKQIDLLFRPFEQGQNLPEHSAGGSGLGLAISKRIVEILGAKLSVDSTVGEGSTFRFTIPTEPLADAKWVFPDPDDLGGIVDSRAKTKLSRLSANVLIVDDRRDMRFLIQRFVESAGGTVEVANDGQQGVQMVLSRSTDDIPIDAILMDMQMPVMDGLEATRTLRASGYQGPIIALTASAMQQDRDDCMKAGCDDVISKPIDRHDLLEKLSSCTRVQTTPNPNQP